MTSHSSSLVRFCHKAFYAPNTKLFNVVGDSLSIVIIISVLSIILESIPALSAYQYIFSLIEYVAVSIFTIEYLGRIIGSEKKKAYIFSFWGLIDLLAILPTLLQLANLTPLKSVRALRILSFLRTLRLVKVARFEHLDRKANKDKKEIIRFNISIYLLTLLFSVLILGNLAYIIEEGNPDFSSIPLSMFWVFETVIGGGVSDVLPKTLAGIGLFMVARFIGFILLGLLINIVGNVFSYILLGSKKQTE
jgi:voltage-gated potassium channel